MTNPQTLRHGSKGQAVQQLQWALNAAGAKLVPDGDFGDQTEKAVRADLEMIRDELLDQLAR